MEIKTGDMIMETKSESVSKKNIAKKMIAVMGDVQHIPKNGYNSFHKYKYALESDISAAFSKALKSHNVFMFTSVLDRKMDVYPGARDKNTFFVSVKIEVTFVDADSGEYYTAVFHGDGTDTGDKAIYKAITGGLKYALMKTFLVSTGDDPEEVEVHVGSADMRSGNPSSVSAAAGYKNPDGMLDMFITRINNAKNLDDLKSEYSAAYTHFSKKKDEERLKKVTDIKEVKKTELSIKENFGEN